MSDKQDPADRRLTAELTGAAVRIHSHYLGRGPTRAQTFYRSNVIVVLMEDAMTVAERRLVESGKLDLVHDMRHEFQLAMRDDLVAVVEQLTGCTVLAFMSDNHIDPDMAAEVFVLDSAVPGQPVDEELEHRRPKTG